MQDQVAGAAGPVRVRQRSVDARPRHTAREDNQGTQQGQAFHATTRKGRHVELLVIRHQGAPVSGRSRSHRGLALRRNFTAGTND